MARGAGGRTMQRILDAALRLFCERGYDATSVDDIVAEVGVTVPVLYYHLGSKEGVLRALVDPLVDALEGLVSRASEVDSSAESRRGLLAGLLDVLIHWRPIVCFLIDDPAVRHHPEVGVSLRRQLELLQARLAGTEDSAATVAAAAALGAVWRPVTVLDEDEVVKHSDTIVDAAVGALRAASP